MSEWLKFVVDHRPVPQPRTRVGKKGVYVPSSHAIHTFKGFVKTRARESKPREWSLDGAFEIGITCFVRPYKGQRERESNLAWDFLTDNDNLEKAVWDSLTGILYHDDRQVVLNHCVKLLATGSESPRVIVGIRSITDEDVVRFWE